MIITHALQYYLAHRFNNSMDYHRKKNRTVNLTYDEFIELIEYRGKMTILLRSFNKWQENGGKGIFHTQYVLSWRNHKSMLAGIVSKDTMSWVTRDRSKVVGRMKIGEKHTAETKKRISELLTGKKHTDQSKQKMSESHIGITFTEERKKHLSEALTGRVQSPEQVRKRSEALKGRAKSPEQIAKCKATWAAKREAKLIAESDNIIFLKAA